MQAHITLTKVTRSALNLSKLGLKPRGKKLHSRADGIPVARRTNEFQIEPIVLIGTFVSKEIGRLIGIGDEDVDVTIIVVVAKGNAAAHFVYIQSGAALFGNLIQRAVTPVSEDQVPLGIGVARIELFDIIIYVSVPDEQVDKPIVVEVYKIDPPPNIRQAGSAQTTRITRV